MVRTYTRELALIRIKRGVYLAMLWGKLVVSAKKK